MRTTLHSRVALGTMVFAILTESAFLWAAEPVRLTETQMDAVTAGTITVGTYATAIADGYPTNPEYTYTSTYTTVITEPSNIVDIGLGYGQAYACCGSRTYTNVQTTYYAEGDRVSASSINVDTMTTEFSYSYGFTSVITVSY